VRDLLANVLARLRATNRQQRLYLALGLVAVLVLVRYGAAWFLDYRSGVKEDIQLSATRIANAKQTLERAPEAERNLAELQKRYRETVARLVPGDTPTLAASTLQTRVSNLAAENNVAIQTTQVLKDEAVGTFRQVSLRVTASGDLKNLAAFLSGLEFGALHVQVSFIELTRRGAAVRRRPGQEEGPRTVSATLQIAGVVQDSAKIEAAGVQPVSAPAGAGAGAAAAPADAGAGAAAAPPDAGAGAAAAPPDAGAPAGSAPAAGAPPPAAVAQAPQPGLPPSPPPLPAAEPGGSDIPSDPLGTSRLVNPPK